MFAVEEGWISPNPVFCRVWVDHMTLFSLHPVKVEQYQIAFQIQDHHRSPDTNLSWSECQIILACCLKLLASILLWIFALVFIKILTCRCILFHGLYLFYFLDHAGSIVSIRKYVNSNSINSWHMFLPHFWEIVLQSIELRVVVFFSNPLNTHPSLLSLMWLLRGSQMWFLIFPIENVFYILNSFKIKK